MYLEKRHIAIYMLAIGILVVTIIAWTIHNMRYCEGETAQVNKAIPFIVFPRDAFEQGYVDGYIEAEKLSIVESSSPIKIKVNLTYIGRETAPKIAIVKPQVDAPEISVPSSVIRSALNKSNMPKPQDVIRYLMSSNILSYDDQGRVWINLSRLVYVEPISIKIRRNTSIIITVSIKPNEHLSTAAKSLLCYMLIERYTTIGRGGATSLSFYVESNPNIQSFPIVIPNINLINFIKYDICKNI